MINELRQLKKIEPGADFLVRSRNEILKITPQPNHFLQLRQTAKNFFQFSFALGLMAIMLLAISGRLAPVPPSLITSLNSKQLARESYKYDFNLQLAEAKYYREVDKQINLALNEIISHDQASP